jgi:hypothetical protein
MWSFSLLILLFITHPSLSFQSALPNAFSFFHLDPLPQQLTDIRFNETMGHSDPMLAIGLNNKEVEPEGQKVRVETIVEPAKVRNYMIPISEMAGALEKALSIACQSQEDITKSGWKIVHVSDVFSLYKRRRKRPGGGDGPVEYLMTGTLPDVSPRAFLHSQLDKECRKQWDMTMKDMSIGSTSTMEAGGDESEDVMYYRTKWPWPMKDRDYTLARRCKLFEEKDAIILVSKSTDCHDYPTNEGVIRVDNYWCHSAILSTRPRVSNPIATSPIPPNDPSPIDIKEDIPPIPLETKPLEPIPEVKSDNTENKRPFKIKKFDPRARLNELKKSAASKKDSFSAASLKKRAKTALHAMKNPSIDSSEKRNGNSKDKIEIEQSDALPVISAVDLPGVSFITLFCDDQKVPLPSTIVDILSKQGEKVVPDSINRLHETAREVEIKKQSEKKQ